jgi:hypothetical protein
MFRPMPTTPEPSLAEELRLLREELFQFRVLLTPELRKTELIERLDKDRKECLAAVRRKPRG